ncbi:MAG TPA: hypothetical protein VK548_08320, partial [Candidatus Acidoferrum sp.]|nr:hypothetical protein [Candidatus Acidoferrum sp.]
LMELAGRLIVLSAGEKIAEWPPATIAADPTVIDVYLGSARTHPGDARTHLGDARTHPVDSAGGSRA